MAKPKKQLPVSRADQEIIDAAIKRLEKCIKADDHNRKASIEDLKFLNGDQWDAGEKKRRADKGRPALQFNLLPKFVDQVVGDMLHNSPSVKVRPVDSKADPNIAKIRQGIISNIEYLSNSKGIYGYGAKQMVSGGYGAWRVLTRYTEENPFLQEAYLESIRNPYLVYMDPDSKDQNYADAKYGFILEKIAKKEFTDRYPKAQFPSAEMKTGNGLSYEHWYDGETITVAEYFTVETETVKMYQLEDGRVVDEEKFDEIKELWEEKNEKLLREMQQTIVPGKQSTGGAPQALPGIPGQPTGPVGMPNGASPQQSPQQAPVPQAPPSSPMASAGGQPQAPQGQQPPQAGPPKNPMAQHIEKLGEKPTVAKTRNTERIVLKHRILTCCEILDGETDGNKFPGKFIPIVLIKGKELNIEGKNHVYSLIRHAKDSQKLLNYWNTAAAESIALAPKNPWLGTAKQFEGYENDYAAANVENLPFLKYNNDPEAPGPPQRVQPGQPPAAIFQMIAHGEDTLKSSIGLFNADVGAAGSEQTGAAITARQRPGDIGTFEFMENLARGVLYTGRILNSIIPEIYDSERDVRLRNIDESETFVPINTTLGHASKMVKQNPSAYTGLDPNKLEEMMIDEGKDAKFNDVTVGKYDVVVTTGPSYATQRQESAQMLMQMMQSMPTQMGQAIDLIIGNMDFKDADELANRFRKPLLMAGVVKPKQGETVPPPQPNPAALQAQAKIADSQAKSEIAKIRLEEQKLKLQEKQMDLQMKQIELQNEKEAMGATNKPDSKIALSVADSRRKAETENRRLTLEEARFAHQQQMDEMNHSHKRNIEGGRLALDAASQFMGDASGAE